MYRFIIIITNVPTSRARTSSELHKRSKIKIFRSAPKWPFGTDSNSNNEPCFNHFHFSSWRRAFGTLK